MATTERDDRPVRAIRRPSWRLVPVDLDLQRPAAALGKATAGSDVVEARFVDIVEGKRVVQAVDFISGDPAFAGTMTMTWGVKALGDGTEVRITAEDVPDGITAEDHAEGLSSSPSNLAAYLET